MNDGIGGSTFAMIRPVRPPESLTDSHSNNESDEAYASPPTEVGIGCAECSLISCNF